MGLVRLRLARFGSIRRPFYRIVAADSRAPRDGRFLEVVGSFNPIPDKNGSKQIQVKSDRIKYWLGVGAQPSDRVAFILGKAGILPMPPRGFNPKKMVPKSERK
mmetsp:Transcript_15905/g.17959  ORF Transcript_15905/g.17959 Transcript_15905/m.17959 type:complete len:104 (+) Transcript_15905:96-407(+)